MSNFAYRSKRLYCENISVEEICKKIGTPFYLYSSKQILDNLRLLSKKFKGCNILIAYAVKITQINYFKVISKKGSGADVVSYGEMSRALKAGIKLVK